MCMLFSFEIVCLSVCCFHLKLFTNVYVGFHYFLNQIRLLEHTSSRPIFVVLKVILSVQRLAVKDYSLACSNE